MLVLTRRRNEKVIVTLDDGRRCEIVVAELRHDKVRLGFNFPDGVTVHREEVQQAIDRQEGK